MKKYIIRTAASKKPLYLQGFDKKLNAIMWSIDRDYAMVIEDRDTAEFIVELLRKYAEVNYDVKIVKL